MNGHETRRADPHEMTATAQTRSQDERAPADEAGHAAAPSGALDAVIFDMDGVVTDTAGAHADAWKRLFDEFLRERADRTGETFEPFDADAEYREYVDGKPRYDGVA